AIGPLQAALAVAQRPRGDAATAAVRARIASGGAALARAAARDVAIMAALGYPLDSDASTFLLANAPQGGVRADAGAMGALYAAPDRRASGEGALLAAIAAGDGPAKLDAESVCYLIRVLRTLGYDDDARRFAIEAILAGQPS